MQNVLDITAIPAARFAAEAPPPAIELRGVTKRFNDVVAVDNVSLTIPRGQVIALLGPNGAGKTTAISLMLGIRRPTSGEATVFGLVPDDLRARAATGVMLQESGVPLQLRVGELIDLFRSYYPRPIEAKSALAMADLDGKAKARAGDLSGGQRQRLYFALAVCGDPDLLFLDEPTVGLDVESRRDFWEQFRQFRRDGKTIVLTTHYLDEADALADRIVVIDRGRVIADDTPGGIKRRASGKRVGFDLPAAASPTLFDGLALDGFERNGDSVRFLTNSPETVLATLFARGAAIANLEVSGAGLEEAFINLIHAKERDA